MKLPTKRALLGASGIVLSAGNALALDGNLSAANTGDIVNNLGLFSGLGQFILEYAIHIVVFFMVVCTVVIYGKGLYARTNKKVTQALEERENLKGSNRNTNGHNGRNTNGDNGRNTNGDNGRNTNGDNGKNTNGDNGKNTNGDNGRNTNGDNGRNTNGDNGRNTNEDNGRNTNGDNGRNTNRNTSRKN